MLDGIPDAVSLLSTGDARRWGRGVLVPEVRTGWIVGWPDRGLGQRNLRKSLVVRLWSLGG